MFLKYRLSINSLLVFPLIVNEFEILTYGCYVYIETI